MIKVLSDIDTHWLTHHAEGDDRIGLAEVIHGLQIAAELK